MDGVASVAGEPAAINQLVGIKAYLDGGLDGVTRHLSLPVPNFLNDLCDRLCELPALRSNGLKQCSILRGQKAEV